MTIDTPPGLNRILQTLPPAEFAEVRLHLIEFTLTQGHVLHRSGEKIEYVYFPLTGMISLLTVLKSGDQIDTGIVGRYGLVGGTIGNNGPLSFGQATVQVGGSAYQLSRDRFLALFDRSLRFRDLVNAYDGYLYFQAQQSAACNAVHTVEARLCRWMLQSQDVLESDVVALTQELLSHMMGVQRNAVSLCAHALQERGLIEYSRGTIKILDREGLKKVSCECFDATSQYAARAQICATVRSM
jgi:CRP-like cAMP-binding protein